MKLKTILIFVAFIATSSLTRSYASSYDNSIWVGFNQNKTDFFGDGQQNFKPEGTSFGFSHQLSSSWQVAFDYGELEEGNQFPIREELTRVSPSLTVKVFQPKAMWIVYHLILAISFKIPIQ